MIIVLVKYHCKPGCRESFLDGMKSQQIDILSQAQKGNIQYEYSLSVDEPDVLMLTEQWADQEAIDSHSHAPHFAGLGKLKAEYVQKTVILRFSASPM